MTRLWSSSFFSDEESFIFPIEALQKVIEEGHRLKPLEDDAEFAGAFGRFPDDETNGYSEEKEARCGQPGTVLTVYEDATVTLRFDDEVEMDFPFEALAQVPEDQEEA